MRRIPGRFGSMMAAAVAWCAALAPGLASAEPILAGAMAVSLQKRDAGTFYLNGAILGYGDVQMLVDTGSSILVINQTVLKELQASGHAVFARNVSGAMADGNARVVPVYRLAALRLGKDCWVRDIEAAVLPVGTRMILGMNVLERLAPFTFSAQPPQLGLNQCELETLARPAPAAESVETSAAAQGISP